MLPQSTTPSPARVRGGGGGGGSSGFSLDWRSAFGAGMAVMFLLGRLLRPGCPPPLPLPPAAAAVPATLASPAAASTTATTPPTAYLRLDEQAWHSSTAARLLPPPTRNGLLALALERDAGGETTLEAPRPHGAPALPASPTLSVVVALPDGASATAAAATLASALAAGAGAEVEVILSAGGAVLPAGLPPPPPAARVLTRAAASPPLADPASALTACFNAGVRAAKAPWAVVLAPGDRAVPGAWAALTAGAAAHPDADVLFTGPAPAVATTPGGDGGGGAAGSGGDGALPGGVEPLPAGPPWRQAIPPGAAFRVAKVWREGGGFPAVPAPRGGRGRADVSAARAAVEGDLWAAAAAVQGRRELSAASVGPEALVLPGPPAPPPEDALPAPLAAALAIAMSGAPLPPSAVLTAQAYVIASARPGGAAAAAAATTRPALRSATLALARDTAPRGCPATAPVDLALGLVHEGGDRHVDAAAAYARAAACADGAGVPALAWAARVRGDAVRAAGLVACVGRAGPAAEPGTPARPASGNAHADAAECVAVLGVAT